MKNTWKIAASAALAAAALAAAAMPTKRQLAEAQQLVKDLTADDIRAFSAKQKTAGEVAAKHLDLLDKAETEACKYLLLQGAFRLYARGGDYDAAADILQRMKKVISDVPPEVIVELVNGEMRRGTESKAPRVLAIYKDARHTIKYRKRLAAAEAEAEKRGTSKSFKPLAECHAHLGNWTKALEVFALARVPAAKWELDQKSVSDYDAFKAAEYWWNYEAEETEPFRAHAAALYRVALAEGLVTGLHIEIIKKRIAEVGDFNANNSVKVKVEFRPEDWAECQPGSFQMGYANFRSGRSPHSDGSKADGTVRVPHKVRISKKFWIAKKLVTRAQWFTVMGEPKETQSLPGNLPITDITVAEMEDFCARVTAMFSGTIPDGYVVRFPTEAEWEYASKNMGRTTEGFWVKAASGGAWNNPPNAEEGVDFEFKKKWYARRNIKVDDRIEYAFPVPVGLRKPNELGIYDMVGNCWEVMLDRTYARRWVKDSPHVTAACYSYSRAWDRGHAEEERDPVRVPGNKYSHFYLLRGDGWHASDCSAKLSLSDKAGTKLPTVGFRLVIGLNPKNLERHNGLPYFWSNNTKF